MCYFFVLSIKLRNGTVYIPVYEVVFNISETLLLRCAGGQQKDRNISEMHAWSVEASFLQTHGRSKVAARRQIK